MTVITQHARLLPHPDTPCPALRSITAEVRREHAALTVLFQIHGDPSQVLIPAPVVPERCDGLWQHTCCEAFVRADGQQRYQEFNFSPNGQWAAYGFTSYRSGMTALPGSIRSQFKQDDESMHLCATLPLSHELCRTRLLLGLSAVIELHAGGLCYWALLHPGERPDFHHPASGCLAIEAPT